MKLREGNILKLKITAVEKEKHPNHPPPIFGVQNANFQGVFCSCFFSPVERVEAHFPPRKLQKTTMNEDVSPKKLGDFPASHVSLLEGVSSLDH